MSHHFLKVFFEASLTLTPLRFAFLDTHHLSCLVCAAGTVETLDSSSRLSPNSTGKRVGLTLRPLCRQEGDGLWSLLSGANQDYFVIARSSNSVCAHALYFRGVNSTR